jgi:hypothetical protein
MPRRRPREITQLAGIGSRNQNPSHKNIMAKRGIQSSTAVTPARNF